MRREIILHAFSSRVLAVAVLNRFEKHEEDDKHSEGDLFDWAAYIDAVPGISHQKEWPKVAKEGGKMRSKIASIIFNINEDKYRA